MRVVVGSAFRNCAGLQITRWHDQILALRTELRQKYYCYIRAIAVEGDSNDGGRTRAQLETLAAKSSVLGIDLINCKHGGPHYGSIESSNRMRDLSKIGNAILSAVTDKDDILVYVESDLIWDSVTVAKLIDRVVANEADVIAPMVFAGDHFYDIYLFRKNGERFSPFPPYHAQLSRSSLTTVDSAGSCLVMKAEVARQCRIRNDEALLGFCVDAHAKGYSIKVDPTLSIRHPA